MTSKRNTAKKTRSNRAGRATRKELIETRAKLRYYSDKYEKLLREQGYSKAESSITKKRLDKRTKSTIRKAKKFTKNAVRRYNAKKGV